MTLQIKNPTIYVGFLICGRPSARTQIFCSSKSGFGEARKRAEVYFEHFRAKERNVMKRSQMTSREKAVLSRAVFSWNDILARNQDAPRCRG